MPQTAPPAPPQTPQERPVTELQQAKTEAALMAGSCGRTRL